MLILAIETATAQVGAALIDHDGLLATHEVSRGRRHAEALAPAIEMLIAQTGVGYDQLGCVAVDVGPGLFTGLRVGMATALAMAQALDIPVIPICSLDALAYQARAVPRTVVSVIDARRGEVFHATYIDDVRLGSAQCSTPDDLAGELALRSEALLLVGDGARRYGELLCRDARDAVVADQAMALPTASAVAWLAEPLARREAWMSPGQVKPQYLRKPDAEINWDTRAGRHREVH